MANVSGGNGSGIKLPGAGGGSGGSPLWSVQYQSSLPSSALMDSLRNELDRIEHMILNGTVANMALVLGCPDDQVHHVIRSVSCTPDILNDPYNTQQLIGVVRSAMRYSGIIPDDEVEVGIFLDEMSPTMPVPVRKKAKARRARNVRKDGGQ